MGYPIFHSQYTAAQIEASIGKTPRIKSSTRTWEVWDIATSAYIDTGVSIDTQLFVDDTLSQAGYAADAAKTGELKSAIAAYSNYDRIAFFGSPPRNRTHNGITFSWNNGICSVSGTASDGAYCNIINSQNAIPSYLSADKTYQLIFEPTDPAIKFDMIVYVNGSYSTYYRYAASRIIRIPENASGIIFRLYVASGSVVSGTVAPKLVQTDEVQDAINDIQAHNAYNLLPKYGRHTYTTSNGISYVWDGNTCHVYGTASNGSWSNLISSSSTMPSYFTPGKTYDINFKSENSGVKVEVFAYKNGSTIDTVQYSSSARYTIPLDATGIIIRLYVASGTTVDEYITPEVLSTGTTDDIIGCLTHLAPKMANFGDSITWGRDGSGSASTQTSYTVTNYLVNHGIYAKNYGVGGMGYFSKGGGQTALEKIKSIDITGFDLISLAYGTNDNNTYLGTVDDTDGTTMLGAMYQCFSYIKEQNPACVVVFIAPPNAPTFGAKATGYWYGYKRGSTFDYNLSELVEGMRAFCNKYGLPFIDNRRNGIDLEAITTLMPDGVHPNDDGYKIYSRYIGEALLHCVY